MVSLSNIRRTIRGSAKHFSPLEFYMSLLLTYLIFYTKKIRTTTFHISFVKKCAEYN
jgi:hypothetical protein